MGERSGIEWTDATWPIMQGCDPVSQGCVHCYAVPLLWRMAHNPDPKISGPVQGLTEKHRNADGKEILRFTGKLALREDRLAWPLSWKKPQRIFVPSHGDIFHKDVPDSFLDKIFAVMALCPQHQFQVLTKRAERMREYMIARPPYRGERIGPARHLRVAEAMGELLQGSAFQPKFSDPALAHFPWPLPNVWLGVSAEDQANADARIPHLLQTPAAIRFVSLEPLLGPIDLTRIRHQLAGESFQTVNALYHKDGLNKGTPAPGLDWIIVGGESGKDARPMHPQWARDIQAQCDAAGVKFFFKQWGAWAPQFDECGGQHPAAKVTLPTHVFKRTPHIGTSMVRVGKKEAGRLLDGKEHNGFPGTPAA